MFQITCQKGPGVQTEDNWWALYCPLDLLLVMTKWLGGYVPLSLQSQY